MIYINQAGDFSENVYHVKKIDGTAPDPDDIADVFAAWEAAEGNDNRSEQMALNKIKVRDMTTATGAGIERDIIPDIVGQHTNPLLPSNVTAAIKWGTGQMGRSKRGRTYHIGLAEFSVNLDVLVDGVRTGLHANYTALLTRLATAGYNLVVASFYSGVDADGKPIPRAAAVVTPITTVTVDPIIDSQRRRLRGRGV
jgi:hypothetical protein